MYQTIYLDQSIGRGREVNDFSGTPLILSPTSHKNTGRI